MKEKKWHRADKEDKKDNKDREDYQKKRASRDLQKKGGENRDKPNQKELRKLKEERRELWRKKKARRDKNKKGRERRKKEQEEEMIRKGKMKTMSQYTLRGWAKGGLGLEGGHDGVQEGRIQRYNAL